METEKSIVNLIDIPAIGDESGYLSVINSNTNIPFDIRRIFYIYRTQKDIVRGRHAHYKVRMVLITVSGNCRISLDNARTKETVHLGSLNTGLLLEPYIWREMFDFSEDCVLLALASELYDKTDYIYDYNKFLDIYANRKGVSEES